MTLPSAFIFPVVLYSGLQDGNPVHHARRPWLCYGSGVGRAHYPQPGRNRQMNALPRPPRVAPVHLHRLSALQTYARENALPVPSLVELHHAALTIGLDRIEAGAAPFPAPSASRSTVAR